MSIPCYPDFAPLALEMRDELQLRLAGLPDGVSEFTFAGLFLFRERYGYRVSLAGNALIFSGQLKDKNFFLTPCALPDQDVLTRLFQTHQYWKCIPDSIIQPNREKIEAWGVEINEDRDNFDYLYLKTDLAELSGKKFHKKRNLVNAFLNMYIPRVEPLSPQNIPLALKVLERWRADKGGDGDYAAAKEALELFDALGLRGNFYYINNHPAGWCMGENLANDTMFAVHFEKGVDEFKGVYQYINQNFAASLPDSIIYINREQDLGDEGLRQAKMTYRPVGFTRKYKGFFKT
jgi:hypothetical protein